MADITLFEKGEITTPNILQYIGVWDNSTNALKFMYLQDLQDLIDAATVKGNARTFYAIYMLAGDYDETEMIAGATTLTGTGGEALVAGQIVLRNFATNKDKNGLWVIQADAAQAIRYSKCNSTVDIYLSFVHVIYGDYATNIYRCDSYPAIFGTSDIEYVQKFLQNQSLDTTSLATFGTAKIGDVAGGNYTEFEGDGTLLGRGDATCYMDVVIPMFLRGVPAEPEAIAFPLNGIGLQPRFRVDDILTLQNAEAPHDWEEGSGIEIHMHYSNGSEDTTDRYIKFTLEYAIANMVANGNTGTQFVRGTQDIEWFIPANTPAYTHLYKTLKVVDATAMANIKIGAGFVGSLKRITATGTAPSVNPYVLNLGIHYKTNTLGSRTTTSK